MLERFGEIQVSFVDVADAVSETGIVSPVFRRAEASDAGWWGNYEHVVLREPVWFPSFRTGKALLFHLGFQVCNNLLRLMFLVFYLVTIVNQSDSFDNDLVVHTNPRLDDDIVLQFLLDDNLALMCHIVFVDHVNVRLVENLKGRLLRDDEGVILHLADQHGAGLAMTQQVFRVREVRGRRRFRH